MTVAVVTGAESGMGRAFVAPARRFADVVVAVDLKAPDVEGTIGVACDVSDPDAVAALVGRVREMGEFRALAHAAGISPTMADARRVFEVDLVGTELLLRSFEELAVPGSAALCWSSFAAYQIATSVAPEVKALIDDPLGPGFLDRIATIITDSGHAYAVAKWGVVRAAARAAVRWGPRGGRVNSIAPGLIDTPMARQEFEQHPAMKQLLDATPLGRLGLPDEVNRVGAFLLSDDAAFVSGIDVLVDGAVWAAVSPAIGQPS